jgi:hypothetical protein
MIGPKDKWRTGYDAVHPQNIPRDAEMIFPYIAPSEFAWSQAAIDAFPHAAVARITVHGASPDWHHASIIDVERSAFDAAQARGFVVARNDFRPGTATVYCSLSRVPEIQYTLKGHLFNLWVADWDYKTDPPLNLPNLVAKQFMHTPGYDKSVVYDPRWHPAGTR